MRKHANSKSCPITTVFLSFLKHERERDFAIVSERLSCTVWTFLSVQRFMTIYELFGHQRSETVMKRSWNGHETVEDVHGTLRNVGTRTQWRIETTSGKCSRYVHAHALESNDILYFSFQKQAFFVHIPAKLSLKLQKNRKFLKVIHIGK